MFKKVSKEQLVPSVFIFFWIFVINLITPMVTTAPAWPMFFVTIFFFVMGGDVKNIPMIFCGGAAGIVLTLVLAKSLTLMSPAMGETATVVLLLFVVLALIIVVGNYVPVFFNNITFAYLTVCTIVLDPQVVDTLFLSWLLMHLVGGAIILGGALLIYTAVTKQMQKRASKIS